MCTEYAKAFHAWGCEQERGGLICSRFASPRIMLLVGGSRITEWLGRYRRHQTADGARTIDADLL